MKARLLAIVLVLVFAPTAVLTFLAGRALREREATLTYRLQAAAETAVLSVGERLRQGLEDDLDSVSGRLAAVRVVGGGTRALEAEAVRLRGQRATVAEAYLFMNPWGFVRPPFETNSLMEGLTDLLRRTIAGTPAEESVWVTHQGAAYGFRLLAGHKDLLAGFRVDDAALRRRLKTILQATAGPEFVLVARGPGIRIGTDFLPGTEAVTVSDSLSGPDIGTEGESVFETVLRARMREENPLAWARLARPYEQVRVMAFVPNPEAVKEMSRIRGRLTLWGIAVLAAGIVTGVWLVFRLSAEEIRRLALRQDFLVGISHDLRTPLASMKVLAESLYLDHVQDAAKRRRFLGTILSECDRLGLLVERVMFLVRFGQDAVVVRPRLQDGGRVVRQAVATFEGILAGREGEQVALECRVTDGLPPVLVDEAALTQVILNLLDNAAKYGRPADGSAAPVTVAVDRVTRRGPWRLRACPWFRVRVADRGPGMPGEVRRNLFQRFYRAPAVRGTSVPGSGLGLSLCAYVARGHGGWIEVESRPGQGAAFSLYLPG